MNGFLSLSTTNLLSLTVNIFFSSNCGLKFVEESDVNGIIKTRQRKNCIILLLKNRQEEEKFVASECSLYFD